MIVTRLYGNFVIESMPKMIFNLRKLKLYENYLKSILLAIIAFKNFKLKLSIQQIIGLIIKSNFRNERFYSIEVLHVLHLNFRLLY